MKTIFLLISILFFSFGYTQTEKRVIVNNADKNNVIKSETSKSQKQEVIAVKKVVPNNTLKNSKSNVSVNKKNSNTSSVKGKLNSYQQEETKQGDENEYDKYKIKNKEQLEKRKSEAAKNKSLKTNQKKTFDIVNPN